MDRQAHWQEAYSSKDETSVSWFQEHPGTSTERIEGCARPGGTVQNFQFSILRRL